MMSEQNINTDKPSPADAMRRLRAERKAAGLCPACGQPVQRCAICGRMLLHGGVVVDGARVHVKCHVASLRRSAGGSG